MADKRNEVCRDFLRGTCTRGSKCKYAHVSSGEAALSGLSFRTDKPIEFCHDFQNGRCNRPTCKYIHCSKEEEEEFRRSGKLPAQLGGDMSAYQAIPTASSRRGMEVREHDAFLDFGGTLMPLGSAQFLNSAAQKNAAFALQSVQLQQAAAFPQFSQAGPVLSSDVEVCKDNLAGRCTRGARCKFRHVTRSQFEYESQLHDATRRNMGMGGERDRRKRSRSRSRSSRSRSRSSSRDGRARRALAGLGAAGSGLVDPLATLGMSAMLNLPAGQQGLLNMNPSLFGMHGGMPPASASSMLSMGLDPSTGMPVYLPMTMSAAGTGANLNSMFSAAGGAALSQANANVGDPFSYANVSLAFSQSAGS